MKLQMPVKKPKEFIGIKIKLERRNYQVSEEKITMTDEDFRYWHYKLWDWLAETGESDKSLFYKFKELGDLDNNGVELHFAVF